MSEKVTNALELIKGMSLMEAAELKKALEDEFGVTAAA
jgi:large subunit ribosomal protein L7/L12